MKEYTVILERGEHNWSAYVPDLPGCIATGKSRADTERQIKEAILFHLEGLRAEGLQAPEPTIEAEKIAVAV